MLIAVLGVLGPGATQTVTDDVNQVVPERREGGARKFALRYSAGPTCGSRAFRWLTTEGRVLCRPRARRNGGRRALVADSGSYTKTHGSLVWAIVLPVWPWISPVAAMLDAEFDAGPARGRRLEAGGPGTSDRGDARR
ncbi:hypothetical protein AB0F91_44495 [Amycolatopsis sp. NPDC023774]|uniref:hypothetical protein n=1 Tax=Amycolatopsis sp. NPDC023774 TaxID=3155015 RepID=UPI0033D8CAA3